MIPKANSGVIENENLLKSNPSQDTKTKSKLLTVVSQLKEIIPKAKDVTSTNIEQKIINIETKLMQCLKNSCTNINPLPTNTIKNGNELTQLDILKYEFTNNINKIRYCGMTNIIDNIRAGPPTLRTL